MLFYDTRSQHRLRPTVVEAPKQPPLAPLKRQGTRIATDAEASQSRPLSKTFRERLISIPTSLKHRLIKIAESFKSLLNFAKPSKTIEDSLSKTVTVEQTRDLLDSAFAEYQTYVQLLNKELNDAVQSVFNQEGTGKFEQALDQAFNRQKLTPHEQFKLDVGRSVWKVQGQQIEDAVPSEKIEAIQRALDTAKVGEPLQWLISRLGNQEALAQVETLMGSKLGALGKHGPSTTTTYEVTIQKEKIWLSILHHAKLTQMDFDKVNALADDILCRNDGVMDDLGTPVNVEGTLSYSIGVEMKRKESTALLSEICFSDANVKVAIAAKKVTTEE